MYWRCLPRAGSHVGVSQSHSRREQEGAAILPVYPIIRRVAHLLHGRVLKALIFRSRYYGPFRQMSDYGPQYCDVRNPEAREKHKAVSCPDKILTAFCQLGALRMRARRCLIFFFDVNHAYIMAEATQTLSLVDDAIHEPGDEVWMGHSIIPRDVACCETTVNLPPFPISAAADCDVKKSAFVVNDLTKHPDLSTRPYVTDFPHGRFYAGVPITTPSGVNIGAYCILDDKVRDGVPEKDLCFLRDMSQTVVNHLESVRALSERQQTNRMVAGLGDFVRRNPSAARKAPPASGMPLNKGVVGAQQVRSVEYRLPDALVDTIRAPAPTSSEPMKDDSTTHHSSNSSASHVQASESRTVHVQEPSDSVPSPANHRKHALLDPEAQMDTASTLTGTVPRAESFTARSPPRRQEHTSGPNNTYQRAAEILCQSLDIDGVAFLDASVRVFGGLSETQNTESNEGSNADSDDSACVLSQSDSASKSQPKPANVCQVLGCAQSPGNDMMDTNHTTSQPTQKLTESFLRRLMRRNPHGKVWKFDEELRTYSEDGFSSDESGAGVKADRAPLSSSQRRNDAHKDGSYDAEVLQRAFPGSRCIALNGIWDFTRKRWAIAGLYWTRDPLRSIAQDTEMRFVDAFCDIIVAETKRLEVLGTDKAKSDFISTVSHELRSPLHGILGSCELLSDHGLDDTAAAFLEQINSCGRTLLDIVEHLLDFADLKSQRLRKGAVKSSRITQKLLPAAISSSGDGLKASDMSVAFDYLTEDAVVSSAYSFYYSQSANSHTSTPVILDIDRSDGKPWYCSLATGGWKRVCINLVTNALKYTPSGFIRVSLQKESKPGSRRRFDAVLTVSDTGKGMSKKFQSDRLFHDFAQEDTLSDGLGLGMHIVSSIVYAMGGSIDVVSDQDGTGTCVTVRVPLELNQNGQHTSGSLDKSSGSIPKAFEGLKVGLVTGVHRPADAENNPISAASAMAIASIESHLKFLRIQSEQCQWRSSKSYDLFIVMEPDIHECLATLRNSEVADGDPTRNGNNLAPVLVVCNNSPSAQILRDSWATDKMRTHMTLEHIALPCGIKQITRTISSVLRLHEKRVTGASETPEAYEKPKDGGSADGVVRHHIRTHHELQLRSLASQLVTTEVCVTEQAESKSAPLSSLSAQAISLQVSPTESQVIQLSSHSISNHQACQDVPSTSTSAQAPLAIKASITSAVVTTTTMPTLLLVDDNNVNLRLLAAFAKKHRYPYLTAQDGQLAVDAFVNAHRNASLQNGPESHNSDTISMGMPTVILMDINMPVMDGYEAVQQIRSYEKKHHMAASKIIAVTALQSEAAQVEAFGSGFDLFLCKPIQLRNLSKLI
jgi:signal transduction histidine kinase/CheY-like chemotaxis protein